VAEAGAWLGGIVPYGYRKSGEKQNARIIICEEPIPGLAMSEADVIREVFRMAAVEGKSCRVIATRLNDLRIPCAYVRDDRLALRGKRKQRTSGVWRAGRVRGLITNKTYMGTHEFGKRSAANRPIISRPVPALVPKATWEKAQKTLQANFLFGKRGARNQYLLRGLIKCGLCGLTYVGVAANRPNGKREFYYRCNGAHTPSVYSTTGRCKSKSIRGDQLEEQVWSDVDSFLRNPDAVLEQLRAKLEGDAKGPDQIKHQVTRLEGLLAQKATERSRMVGLYRRGKLTDPELDAQMDEIGKEETALATQISELGGRIEAAGSIAEHVGSAQALLAQLRKRLDQPVSWEQKRRLVEVIVGGICVDTVEEEGVRQNRTTVTYRFSQPNQSMALALPQTYSTGHIVRIPTVPKTVGDHIRKRRLGLKLHQREVAEQLGVAPSSLINWEGNWSSPEIRYMPAIIKFLGYDPLPAANTLGEQLVRQRRSLGLSQKESAQGLGVDPGTLARWERGEREPTGAFAVRVQRFVKAADEPSSQAAALIA
jgi:site-specific DNA recombinase